MSLTVNISIIFLMASFHTVGPTSTLISSKILNGNEFMDEYHLLYFQEDEVLLCAGYLVAWRIAVGGAQCFFKKDTSRFKASNFYYHEPKESSESKRYYYKVEKVEVHPNFTLEQPKPYLNDIAVVLLTKKENLQYFTTIEEIKALVLTDEIPPHQNVDIIGWRPLESYCIVHERAKLIARTKNNEYCQSELGYKETHQSLICVDTHDGLISKDDIGCPLLIGLDSEFYNYGLIGIHSFSLGTPGHVAVFTRISYHHTFILKSMENLYNYACQFDLCTHGHFVLNDEPYKVQLSLKMT